MYVFIKNNLSFMETQETSIFDLPVEIQCLIFDFVPETHHLFIRMVCKQFNEIIKFDKTLASNLFSRLVCQNDIHCLDYAVRNGCNLSHNFLKIKQIYSIAVTYSSVEMMDWLYENEYLFIVPPDCYQSFNSTESRIEKSAEMYNWLKVYKKIWHHGICWVAAKNGRLDILQWARKHHCFWNDDVFYQAAENNHFELLDWAVDNGCSWTSHRFTRFGLTDLFDHKKVFENCHSKIIEHIKNIGKEQQYGGPFPVGYAYQDFHAICHPIAKCGDLIGMEEYIKAGHPLNAMACANAARKGNLLMLKLLVDANCPWDESVCSKAALGNHKEIIEWAREKGCPWDEQTCINAAKKGHLELLQWLRKNGCPWDKQVCSSAARNGQLRVLHWARSMYCPWDEQVCIQALKYRQYNVIHWIIENGCPMNDFCRKILVNIKQN